MGTHPLRPQYFEPYLTNQNFTFYFFSPSPGGSKKVWHIPTGQYIREEIYFVETGHVLLKAVPWRLADLRPLPQNYSYRVWLVLKILSRSLCSIKSYSTFSWGQSDRQTREHTDIHIQMNKFFGLSDNFHFISFGFLTPFEKDNI